MNAAARRIEEVNSDSSQHLRVLRSARLSPLRDISSDIQRASTPLPSTAFDTVPYSAMNSTLELADVDTDTSEEWPWDDELDGGDPDIDDGLQDAWADQPDPLEIRQFPTFAEGRRIDEDDIRLALGERISMMMVAVRQRPRRYLRLLLIWVLICALIALVIDSTMISLLAQRSSAAPLMSGQLSLTLSKSKVRYGDAVVIHLRNFTPAGLVILSRNIGDTVVLTVGSPLVRVGLNGALDVTMSVRPDWNPGQQMIEAEDVHTHYTASAILLLVSGQSLPAHLSVSNSQIDFGSQVQGNTNIEAVNLINTGGGSISWSASSQSSWLMLTPPHGLFSNQQTFQIAADRAHLQPGRYKGSISIISNVSSPLIISAFMTVLPIPKDVGAIMNVTPSVLSFTAIDGGANPAAQSLTISNEGHKNLYWQLDPQSLQQQSSSIDGLAIKGTSWLHLPVTSGQIAPGSSKTILVQVNNSSLMQGTYTSTITFRSNPKNTMYNDPQQVAISLTMQPSCSVLLSTGSMAFTASAGQSVATQSLSLTSGSGCRSAVNWSASTSAHWLSLSPSSGSVTSAMPTTTTVNVNPTGMPAGTYEGFVTVTANHSSQSLAVRLLVQAAPTLNVPVLGVAPLGLNFNPQPGATGTMSQTVALTNTGNTTLLWQATEPGITWLSLGALSGSIPAGGSAHLLVNVTPGTLTPYQYTSSIPLKVTDSSGNPIVGGSLSIGVSLVVSTPCTITMPSSSSLAFTSTQGGNDPTPSQVSLAASGSCAWPLTWKASSDSPSWLNVSSNGGTFNSSGQTAALIISPTIQGQLAGNEHGRIAIVVTDSNGNVVSGASSIVSVDMIIMAPCSLQANSNNTQSITVGQGLISSVQTVGLNVTGNCSLPVNWTATATTVDGSNWLDLVSTAGSDSGSGSNLMYQVDATGLIPGSYSGTISFSASDASNTALQSTVTIPVQLVVTGFNVGGSVSSCDMNNNCTPVPGATITLTGSVGTPAVTVSAADGTFQFTNVANGSYVLSASNSATTYLVTVSGGSAPVTVTVPTEVTTPGAST
ncbi:carboxypeptidase regulatory-like domain-containing protein [Ktedonobacteria bacterium brp13]|nr:carboxypeptidase regulatory-like domain-containing protein [Ktedonobacteria bacterium brp13]